MTFHLKCIGSLLLAIFLLESNTYAQENDSVALPAEYVKYDLFRVSLGAGGFNYIGDIGDFAKIGTVDDVRLGYNLNLSYRFFSMFSANLNGYYGQVSKSERTGFRNLNFESTIMGGDLTFGFHLDNKYMLSGDKGQLSPYLFGGVGYFLFQPMGDLKDAEGGLYYYWADGSIRNLPENDASIADPTLKTVERDHNFETELSDPNNNYSKSSITFPVGFGLKANVHRNVDVFLQGTYYFTQTDFLDNFQAGTANDGFWYASLGVAFNFQKGPKKEGPDVDSLMEGIDPDIIILGDDSDADGVPDFEDNCPFSPEGIKVDSKGCAIDKDGDGIPDHEDAEPDSKKDAVVDQDGVEISDSLFQDAFNDSIVTNHDEICKAYPSLCEQLSLIEEVDKLDNPDKYLDPEAGKPKFDDKVLNEADSNFDGKITSQEIYGLIDKFFDGSTNLKIEDIHKVIDYFFEQ